MSFLKLRLFIGILTLGPLLACSGGRSSQPAVPILQQQSVAASGNADARTIHVGLTPSGGTYALPSSAGMSGTISMTLRNAATATITLGDSRAVAAAPRPFNRDGGHNIDCPPVPLIPLENSSGHPLEIDLTGFTLTLSCDFDQKLFGVSFYQTVPQPTLVSSLKIGDVTAHRKTITFKPTVRELTLSAHSTYVIAVVAETSKSDVALPVVPGATTLLTSNAPAVPSTLSFSYANASGGSLYSSACFAAYGKDGSLVPALRGVPLVGTPSLYCHLVPADSAITFGNTVTFSIGNARPDVSFLELDGQVSAVACSPTVVAHCDTPAFTIPSVQNVIVGNAKDIAICVPLHEKTDCNNVARAPVAPAPAAAVEPNAIVHLLVADDPTYAAPNFGGFTLATPSGSACLVFNGSDRNADVPPNYADPGGPEETPPVYGGGTSAQATFDGIGPLVEFDLKSGSAGTCSVTVHETTGLKRTATFSIPIEKK